ncbi:hypothetical protein ABK040_006889 [Willaertia magna]
MITKKYSYLNHYFHLKTKQFKLNKEKKKPLFYDEHLDCLSLNILVTGPNGYIGKSSIAMRYIQNLFEEQYDPTMIDDSYRKLVTIDETQYSLEVYSTSQNDDDTQKRIFLRWANGALFVCDLTNKQTLNDMEESFEWFSRIKDDERNDLPIVIVGNKLDLIEQDEKKREITKEMISEIIEKCKNWGKH